MNFLKSYSKISTLSYQSLRSFASKKNSSEALFKPIVASFSTKDSKTVEKPDFDKIYDKTSNAIPPKESDSGFSTSGADANSQASHQPESNAKSPASNQSKSKTIEKPDFDKIYDKTSNAIPPKDSDSGFSSSGANKGQSGAGNKN